MRAQQKTVFFWGGPALKKSLVGAEMSFNSLVSNGCEVKCVEKQLYGSLVNS